MDQQFTCQSSRFRARFILTPVCLLAALVTFGQKKATIAGILKFADTVYAGASVSINATFKTTSDQAGYFQIDEVPYGRAVLEIQYEGTRRYTKILNVNTDKMDLKIQLGHISLTELDEVTVRERLYMNGLGKMGSTRGTAIFEGKKNDVLVMSNIDANVATNNTRQVFAKVAGTNIWENDGSGIQVNVSSRGLSPNRSWEYNMRQNEYDIAADIMGYPDMYYSPPMEAISHIEVVRGSASLQYGTQLGGLMNFVLKQGSTTKPIEIESKQSVGAYGLFNSYNSIGGTKGKLQYFGYFHHRSADGWRENSDYKWNTGFASLSYKVNDKLKLGAEFTMMDFLLHLSAGLADSMFHVDARKSVRERNWFRVSWRIPSLRVDYKLSKSSRLSIVSYMLLSSRKSIENTKTVDILADTGYRDIRVDRYRNFGLEARSLTDYAFTPKFTGTLAAGVRFYRGRTLRGQGLGTAEREPDFTFLHPDNLEYSDYAFRNTNLALFAENIFKIGKLSVVPGIRYEYIKFVADGYYNASGNRTKEDGASKRQFPLLGIGLEYKLKPQISLYANATQGYRAANFNDIRITSPNLVIDPDLKDSKGYNVDLGVRGKYKNFFNFDIDVFYLNYSDRIGLVTRTHPDNTTYVISTNIASSRNTGIETFADVDFIKVFNPESKKGLSLFVSYAYIDARYTRSEKDFLKDKKVEFAPQNILRSGLTFKLPMFSTTLGYSYVDKQFSDANNTIFTRSGSNGLIPSYQVFDWSSDIKVDIYRIGLSINNIGNKKYFTRRATSYPGPGLIPAEPRTFVVSFGVKI
jgi:Fe(3+) dicitrate transport protein